MKKFKPNSANSIVKKILEINPESRDNDQVLYSHYMAEKGYNVFTTSTDFLLELIGQKRLQCPSVIFRRRRGIQELFKDLRGKRYNERHNVQEDSFKEELGYPEKQLMPTVQGNGYTP